MSEYSCPHCKEVLEEIKIVLICPNCHLSFPIKEDIPDFRHYSHTNTETLEFFDRLHFTYESLPYLAGLYSFYGQLDVKPIKKMVPLITILLKDLINEMLDVEEKVILDAGCGTGIYSRSIAKEAKKVYGVDLSMGMLKSAKNYSQIFGLNNINFICASVENLPFKDNFFDGISCCFALHLFNNFNECLDEMNRVLVENGKLTCITHLKKGIWQKKEIYDIYIKQRQSHLFEIGELKTYIENTGFSDFKYVNFGSMIAFEARKV